METLFIIFLAYGKKLGLIISSMFGPNGEGIA
jgi:hypothetical protein